jgi:hypothetical protein
MGTQKGGNLRLHILPHPLLSRSNYRMDGRGMIVCCSTCAWSDQYSLGLADLPLNGECYFRAGAVLTWEAELKTRKSWLSQANHIMYKTGLSAGKLCARNIAPRLKNIYSQIYVARCIL